MRSFELFTAVSNVLLPFVLLIYYYIQRQHLKIVPHPLVWFIGFSLVHQIIQLYTNISGTQLWLLQHVFGIWHLFITVMLLKEGFNTTTQKVLLAIVGLFTLLWFGDIVFIEGWHNLNSLGLGLSHMLTLLICMAFLLNIASTEKIMYFQRLPEFWVATAFLQYAALTILSVISYRYFFHLNMIEEANSLLAIESFANIIRFVLIIVALVCYKRLYIR
ncbi:MAG TPA: hypothetical protein DCL43_16550 [Chitinophagaceae bacterium]|nr:hypothetical protein [Chitinophagaceae bacterium]